MTKTLNVDGMSCGGCAGKVKRALEALAEVESVEVSHVEKNAVVTLKSDVSNDVLKQAVEGAGHFTLLGVA